MRRALICIAALLPLVACGSSKQAEQKKIDQQHQAQANSFCQSLGASQAALNSACVGVYNQYNPTPQVK
jgi:hypothetical protein